MTLCLFDDRLICRACGYQARVRNAKRRCPVAKEAGPGPFAILSNYAQALATWFKAGRPVRDDYDVADILSRHCEPCPHFTGGQCNKCGCPVNKSPWGWRNKLRMATESCPIGLWGNEWSAAAPVAPLRVGFVTPVLMVGGVERWKMELIRAMNARTDVTVSGVAHVGRKDGIDERCAEELSALCPIVSMTGQVGTNRVVTPDEAVYAVAQGSDVLIVWSISGAVLDALRATGLPIVGVSHGAGDWWMRKAAGVVRHWVAVSDSARAPIPTTDCATINNGIGLDRLVVTRSREAVRREVGLPQTAKVAVSIGRLSKEKRLELAVAALDYLPPDWWLWLVGDGHESFSHSRLLVSSSRNDIGNIYAASDVAVLTSETEGYCLSAVEALAAGVQLVSTPVGIVPELIGHCLPLTPTPQEVADAILAASKRHNGVQVAALKAKIGAEHSAEAMAERWAKYLKGVVHADRL